MTTSRDLFIDENELKGMAESYLYSAGDVGFDRGYRTAWIKCAEVKDAEIAEFKKALKRFTGEEYDFSCTCVKLDGHLYECAFCQANNLLRKSNE